MAGRTNRKETQAVRHSFVPIVFAKRLHQQQHQSQRRGQEERGAAGKSSRSFRFVRSSWPPFPLVSIIWACAMIWQVGVKRRSHLARR